MRFLLSLLLFYVFHISIAYTQGENNNWYINDLQLLNFNESPMQIDTINARILNSAYNMTVSSSDGELLFFSDGIRIFDREAEQMPNGRITNSLFGFTSIQPVVGFQHLDDPNQYHVFYVKNGLIRTNEGSIFFPYTEGELYYSVLDMSLNNGRGDIVAEENDILVQEGITGGMVALQGYCGAIWVLVHEYNTNRFLAFEVTEQGIAEPVISEVGAEINYDSLQYGAGINGLYASPQHDKVVSFHQPITQSTQLFDFDRKTGRVSNPVTLPIERSARRTIASGVFSPEGRFFYTHEFIDEGFTEEDSEYNSTRIIRFDLRDDSANAIQNSKTTVDSLPRWSPFNYLQRAPDGNIYGTIGRILYRIQSPDDLTPSNVVVTDSIVGTQTATANYNLPSLVVTPTPPIEQDSVMLPQDTSLCAGQELVVEVEAEGSGYLWQDGNTSRAYTINAPGIYAVEVQKGNCTFRDTIEVLEGEAPDIDLGEDRTICDPLRMERLSAGFEPDWTFLWHTGSQVPDIPITESGLYWVEVTNPAGCTARDSVQLQYSDFDIVVGSKTHVSCFGANDGSVLIGVNNDSGIPPYDYDWDSGDTGSTDNGLFRQSNLGAGNYSMTVSDATGCQDTVIYNIEEPEAIELNLQIDRSNVCTAGAIVNATTTGGVTDEDGYTYAWSNGLAVANNVLLRSPGIYTLSVTDANNCLKDTTLVFTASVVSTTDTVTVCPDETYLFQNQTLTESGLYTDTLTASVGCDSIVGVNLTVLQNDTTIVEAAICEGESYDFNGETLTEKGFYEQELINFNGCDSLVQLQLSVLPIEQESVEATFCSGSSYTFQGETFTEAGTYIVEVENENGCNNVFTLFLTESDRFETITEQSICTGDSIQFQNNFYFESGLYLDTLTAAAGCDSIVGLQLAVNPPPVVSIAEDTALCPGESGTLTIQDDFDRVEWSTGEVNDQILIAQEGSYSVTVTDAAGCMAEETFVVTQVVAPDWRLDVQAAACADAGGGSVEITTQGGVPPFQYRLNAGVPQNNPEFMNLQSGNYDLQLLDAEGCTYDMTFALPEPNALNLTIQAATTTVQLGDSVRLEAITNANDFSIQWSPNDFLNCDTCLTVFSRPLRSTAYHVTIQTPEGCSARATIELQVSKQQLYYAPNAFSPNNDGHNDLFRIYPSSAVEQITNFRIFDRWGNEVFVQELLGDSEPAGWDGTVRGQVANAGVYIFTAQLLRVDSLEEIVSGEVVLMK